VLHDPKIPPRDNLSKEKYMSKGEKQTSINHFHEKLFKLKDIMKTEVKDELCNSSLNTVVHLPCLNQRRNHCLLTLFKHVEPSKVCKMISGVFFIYV
jgi:hypothetical protein